MYIAIFIGNLSSSNTLKAVYERLVKNGKPKKVAIVAVMRKLLILSYGVLKSEKLFDINYQMTD